MISCIKILLDYEAVFDLFSFLKCARSFAEIIILWSLTPRQILTIQMSSGRLTNKTIYLYLKRLQESYHILMFSLVYKTASAFMNWKTNWISETSKNCFVVLYMSSNKISKTPIEPKRSSNVKRGNKITLQSPTSTQVKLECNRGNHWKSLQSMPSLCVS